MKNLISIMIIGAMFSTSLCGCTGNTENTPKSEENATQATEEITSPSTPFGITVNCMDEEATEPLTAEESLIVEIVKDYITSIERFDIDAIAKLYDPAVLSDSKVYESLKKIRDDACSSGVASDDYEAIWKLTEEYEDLKFTFNDYATCEIIGNSAHVSIDYLADFCDRGYQVQYAVTFGFAMTRINDEWYLSDDPNYDNSALISNADDFEDPYSAIDTAYDNAESINLIINKCYGDIQNNRLKKYYNVESGDLITVADSIKAYGRAHSFFTVENNGHSYTPHLIGTKQVAIVYSLILEAMI